MKTFFCVASLFYLGQGISVLAASAPVIYQATGLSPADIEPVVDQFRRDISRGGTDNGTLPGPLSIGRRELGWENAQQGNIITFPEEGVRVYSGPGAGLQISGGTAPFNFSDIDPSYAGTFQSFGAPGMLASVFTPGEIGFGFAQPGPIFDVDMTYGVNAIGIIFSDVDVQGSTYIRLFSPELRFEVPAHPGTGTLSFLGISFGDQNVIDQVALRLGNAPLAPGRRDGAVIEFDPFLGQPAFVTDLVTIDRVIFGEPSAVPEPSTVVLIGVGLLISILKLNPRRWF